MNVNIIILFDILKIVSVSKVSMDFVSEGFELKGFFEKFIMIIMGFDVKEVVEVKFIEVKVSIFVEVKVVLLDLKNVNVE